MSGINAINHPPIKSARTTASENQRKETALKIKESISLDSKKYFDKKIITDTRDNPMKLAKIENIETTGKSINDIIEIINDFVECTENAIDELVEQYTKTKEQIK